VIIGVSDRRRPDVRSEALAARLSAVGDVPLTVLELVDETFEMTASPVVPRSIRLSGTTLGHELVEHIGRGDDALVVLDAHGGGFPGDRLLDDDVETVLERTGPPVMVVGPNAATVMPNTLLVAVDAATPLDAAARVATRWHQSFGATQLELVELVAPDPWPPDDVPDPGTHRLLGHLAVRLERCSTSDPVDALLEVTAQSDNPALLVVAPRWPGRSHWYSTARHLVRQGTSPVIVVSADVPSDR
jgi:hypothetical protein